MTSFSQNNPNLFALIFVPKILFGPLPFRFYPQSLLYLLKREKSSQS